MCVSVTAFSRRGFISRDIVRLNSKQPHYPDRNETLLMSGTLLRRFPVSSCITDISRILSTFSSARAPISFNNISEVLTKQRAKEFTSKLSSEERKLFLAALNECKSEEDKAGYEGQLAAFRWRSKLGRPSKIPSLGEVDPTGTYCPVPDDWLSRKSRKIKLTPRLLFNGIFGYNGIFFLQCDLHGCYSSSTLLQLVENVAEPSTKELVLVAIANAIPFVGFGFLDNFIMIIAGDQIEVMLNAKFPISTMAAAALGNTVSDVIGIGSVHYVEMFAQKVGFEAPKLTLTQLNLPRTRVAANVGRVIGVTIGCLIGMTPIPVAALFR
ncbi:PREDICTED: uncharacterized protein LOC106745305 isoform X1 [Dinoponera quadriceps]|uniref:Uncharacterized protein LOC106745305 isoform X1 n=1 Tax=Dinoponera quadriceps TaxID=609295 RepID=A0A6P3XEJ1_DINQU|nr:PREDICTED: uncharacterized protein LOC106745305 isoform X1 [Dinoponera quadriceps]